jgi:hypothetical protein
VKRNFEGQFIKLTTKQLIKRLKRIFTKENYSYKKVKYDGYRIEVNIKCNKNKHGFFKRRPEILFKKRGCYKCLIDKEKERFIERANIIHKNKYNYSKVDFKNYKTYVLVICNIKLHKPFLVTPDNHIGMMSGCPACGRIKSIKKTRKPQKQFVKQLKFLFRNKYSYKKVKYLGAKVPVILICKKHGEFTILPDSLLRGSGCFDCGRKIADLKRRKSTKYFIEKAKKIHGEKYKYNLVNYKTAKKEVKIICKNHGTFIQLPYIHLTGSGCNKCGNETIGKRLRNSIEKVIIILEEKRGKGRFDYTSVSQNYKNNKTPLLIKCNIHNKFFYQNADDHSQGGGCEKCVFKSIGEELIMSILKEKRIKYIHNWNKHNCKLGSGKAKFDYYLPKYNLIIEYDGEQHFKPIQYGSMTIQQAKREFKIRKKYDRIKNIWARRNNIKLIRIKYDQKPRSIINKELKN